MPNPTDRLIIGTAGHIDHGKSTLVRALTGVDPDRLKEEKERGITIVLGFAPLDLPSGRRCGVVDVPGHERLVRTMIAGASGIDLVLLVVAADEGTMPQTREHLAICQLLGVEHGVIAITKKDLVDEEWLELVRSDLADEVKGTFLEGAPIVPCSSTSGEGGEGLDELRAVLDKVAAQAAKRDPDGLLRMPVDRVFTMKGFGTVATGTLIGGRLRVGDAVSFLPSGLEGRVRGLQVHGEAVEASIAGTRTAVNVQGSEAGEVHRGEWLVHPGAVERSYRLDVHLTLLPIFPRPLKARSKALVHAGTTHVEAVVRLLEGDKIEPGSAAYAHLELSGQVVVLPGDRLILRGTERLAGHGHTIGGAVVVRPQARRPRKRARTLEEVRALAEAGSDAKRLSLVVEQHGLAGIDQKPLVLRSGVGPQAASRLLKELVSSKEIVRFGQQGNIHARRLSELVSLAADMIKSFHASNPLEAGMPREELRSKLPSVTPALFGLVLDRLGRTGDVVVGKEIVHEATFKPAVSLDAVQDKIKAALAAGGLTPPRDKELAQSLEVEPKVLKAALKLLIGEGDVVKVAEGLYFATKHVEELEGAVVRHLEAEERLTAQEFKVLTGASRKFTIPLGEYFDRQKLTMRVGDARVLRRKSE